MRGVKRSFICSFFSTERRTNQEAPPQLSGFWLVATVAVGGLRNSLRSNSPRPFPSVSLASSPPDKGGIGVCALARILTPSPFGHSPYIPFRNTGGEVEMYSSFALAPILYKTPRHATGHGRGGGEYPPQSSEGIKRFKVILSILSLCSSQMR